MYKILVADDEKDVVSLLKDYLELKGYCVYTAYNGEQAIKAASESPDLILLDVNMPEADGFEVKTGDVIALNGDIIARGEEVDDVVLDVLKKYSPDDICVVDLYYGAEVEEAAATALSEKVMELLPDCDVRCIPGGQPHYDYFISIS